MITGSPIESLARVLYSAVYLDAPTKPRLKWDYEKYPDRSKYIKDGSFKDRKYHIEVQVRPSESDIEIVSMYEHTFGSTACGHGGMGGAAMTTTWVVCLRVGNCGLVYTASRLLKKFDLSDAEGREKFADIYMHRKI